MDLLIVVEYLSPEVGEYRAQGIHCTVPADLVAVVVSREALVELAPVALAQRFQEVSVGILHVFGEFRPYRLLGSEIGAYMGKIDPGHNEVIRRILSNYPPQDIDDTANSRNVARIRVGGRRAGEIAAQYRNNPKSVPQNVFQKDRLELNGMLSEVLVLIRYEVVSALLDEAIDQLTCGRNRTQGGGKVLSRNQVRLRTDLMADTKDDHGTRPALGA
jgi:hypothetical protein